MQKPSPALEQGSILTSTSANVTWLQLLHDIMEQGEESSPRSMKIKELIGWQTVVDMKYPLVTVAERKLGYHFAAAEAAWILSGDDRVESIAPFSKNISAFSDDGVTFFGAYGPKIRDQLDYAIKILEKDPDTRQAVINIWRENPPKSNDIPCSLSVQFLIRDYKIHTMYTMRSSDAWLGWPYDVHNFTMLTSYIMIHLKKQEKFAGLELGHLVLNAGSQHLYERDWEKVEKILANSQRFIAQYPPFNPKRWTDPMKLVDDLWDFAHGAGALAFLW